MGGHTPGDFEEPLLNQTSCPIATAFRDVPIEMVEDGNGDGENGMVFESSDDDFAQNFSPRASAFDYDTKGRNQVYKEMLKGYDETQCQIELLERAKTDITSYRPGLWIEYFNGKKVNDYDIPNTTTLLLVGPKGSGKSSLVNRISRVLNDDKFACDRAQVSYNYLAGAGSHFLLEYMIPKGATSFCLYDTRSLSEYSSENMKMLKNWMTKGVRHGEPIIWDSDGSSVKDEMKYKARHNVCPYRESRTVNFVIFVVNGLSVLRSMEGDAKAKLSMNMTGEPLFLKLVCTLVADDKPVVVMTHGDLLSVLDRVRVRLHVGELLGVPPLTQVFDIPENHNHATELEVVRMLRYCLEHSDRNLPRKALKVFVSTSLFVLFALLFISSVAHFSSRGSLCSPEHCVPPLRTPEDWRPNPEDWRPDPEEWRPKPEEWRPKPEDWTGRLWLGEEYD